MENKEEQVDTIPYAELKDGWVRESVLKNTRSVEYLEADVSAIKGFLQQIDGWRTAKYKNTGQYTFRLNTSKKETKDDSRTELLLEIQESFAKLESDFESVSRRIAWCSELEDNLSNLEDEIDDSKMKYFSWFVATLRDVFAYNYAEQLALGQLVALKVGIEFICKKSDSCSKESFEKFHSELIESGLSTLPTTEKVIRTLGE